MINTVFALAFIWRNQRLSYEALRRVRDRKFRRLIRHAQATSPYYQSLWAKAGVDFADVRTSKDIARLPIVSRAMLQEAADSVLSSRYRRSSLIVESTSGSTGRPLTVYRTQFAEALARASKLRTFLANDYRLSQVTANLELRPVKEKWFHCVGIHRVMDIPITESLAAQFGMLTRVSPEVLQVLPSRILPICAYAASAGETPIRPNIIFSSSEMLSDECRERIRDAFGVWPTDIYANTENKCIAWECPERDGYHLNSDLHIVEVVPTESVSLPNRERWGRIVITDLTNLAMPFIRYDTEDLGVLSDRKCQCGRSFPLLEKVVGRDSSRVVLSDERSISGELLGWSIMSEETGVLQYQLRQYRDTSLELFVEEVDSDSIDLASLRQRFLEHGFYGPLKITRTTAFQQNSHEKHRTFITEIEER